MKTENLPLHSILDLITNSADHFASDLEPGAPEAAVNVLNDLDEVAGLPCTLQAMIDHDAAAKVRHAAGYCRRTSSAGTLGHVLSETLDAAADRMEKLISAAGL